MAVVLVHLVGRTLCPVHLIGAASAVSDGCDVEGDASSLIDRIWQRDNLIGGMLKRMRLISGMFSIGMVEC